MTVSGAAYMSVRAVVVVIVGSAAMGLALGCGGERVPPDREGRVETQAVEAVSAVPTSGDASPAKPREIDPGCWAADIELADGDCRSAHSHIANALGACSAKGGEAIAVEVGRACATGFRAAAVTCCPGRLQAPVQALSLPEPIAADATESPVGACSEASAIASAVDECARDGSVAEAIAEVVAGHAAAGEELRSYRYFGRCADGGFAGFATASCTPGYRRD